MCNILLPFLSVKANLLDTSDIIVEQINEELDLLISGAFEIHSMLQCTRVMNFSKGALYNQSVEKVRNLVLTDNACRYHELV